jgi:hypothetical protein
MNNAEYLELVLKGFAENRDYLIDYFIREAEKAHKNHIGYNEFFQRTYEAVNLLKNEADKGLNDNLLLAHKWKTQEKNENRWSDEKEKEYNELVEQNKSTDYSINLIYFTNNKYIGSLYQSQIKYLKEQFSVAVKQICYNRTNNVYEVEAKEKYNELKEDFLFRNKLNATTLNEEFLAFQVNNSIIKEIEKGIEALNEKEITLGEDKSIYDRFYSNFAEYPGALEYVKWKNNYYLNYYLDNTKLLAIGMAKIIYYSRWLLNELENFVIKNDNKLNQLTGNPIELLSTPSLFETYEKNIPTLITNWMDKKDKTGCAIFCNYLYENNCFLENSLTTAKNFAFNKWGINIHTMLYKIRQTKNAENLLKKTTEMKRLILDKPFGII